MIWEWIAKWVTRDKADGYDKVLLRLKHRVIVARVRNHSRYLITHTQLDPESCWIYKKMNLDTRDIRIGRYPASWRK